MPLLCPNLRFFQPDQFEEGKEKQAAAEQNAKDKDQQVQKENSGTTGMHKAVNLDEENISGPEDFSEVQNAGVGGGHRFENLIKSMLARLELHNSLAPIQQYGRH